ncbi:hypothetical protein PYK79_10760 [Streptomyces sp. ID05-04B]|uniref:hypothetical protein n=1 Tax=Streptomyces sp. ID05-04B TaxID=3028661 RepID=UPI0029C3D41A|nr:hypothetical protein [Streptomyces sp. ID05-04B]MDX5563733.1 hypothetical protein [Streptomyces sp. ID05-04B]
MSGFGEFRQLLIDALNEEHNPSYWGGEPRNAEQLVNDFARELAEVAEREAAAARKYAEEMRNFCSPHGISVHYADQLVQAREKGAP